MYQVLGKDTIENEIIPHLSVAKRGFKTTTVALNNFVSSLTLW
jgi:hypothetical protein